MNFKLKNCTNCGSKELHIIDEETILCMKCRNLHEIDTKKVDGLSFWLYKKEYKRDKKKELVE